MALTPEVIKANPLFASLPDDQLAALATLSVNDEARVIGEKIGQMHGQYDTDIKTISGLDKEANEKSFDYLKRTLGKLKTDASSSTELQTKLQTSLAEITDLKKQIQDGNTDAVLKKQLQDAIGEANSLKEQIKTDKETWDKEKNTLLDKASKAELNSEFKAALGGLKFKNIYPASVTNTLVESAKANILAQYKADWVEIEGKQVMVYRDSKGEIVRNKSNLGNPYTTEELLREALKDTLEVDRKQGGAGTGDPKEKREGAVELADISGATTQVEADELIVKHLIQMGIPRTSQEFANKQKEIRLKLEVAKLKVR